MLAHCLGRQFAYGPKSSQISRECSSPRMCITHPASHRAHIHHVYTKTPLLRSICRESRRCGPARTRKYNLQMDKDVDFCPAIRLDGGLRSSKWGAGTALTAFVPKTRGLDLITDNIPLPLTGRNGQGGASWARATTLYSRVGKAGVRRPRS